LLSIFSADGEKVRLNEIGFRLEKRGKLEFIFVDDASGTPFSVGRLIAELR
jgi:hypothetical protein